MNVYARCLILLSVVITSMYVAVVVDLASRLDAIVELTGSRSAVSYEDVLGFGFWPTLIIFLFPNVILFALLLKQHREIAKIAVVIAAVFALSSAVFYIVSEKIEQSLLLPDAR